MDLGGGSLNDKELNDSKTKVITNGSASKSKNNEAESLGIKRRVNDRSTNHQAKKPKPSYRSESSVLSSPVDLNCESSSTDEPDVESAIDLSTKMANHRSVLPEPSRPKIIKSNLPSNQNSLATDLSPFFVRQSDQILLSQLYPLANYNLNLLNYLINYNVLDREQLFGQLDQFNSQLKLLTNDKLIHQPKQFNPFSSKFDHQVAPPEPYHLLSKFASADQQHNDFWSNSSLWKRIFST